MSVTSEYARIHAAFIRVARDRRLKAFDVRMLVAIHELGGEVSYEDLYVALACEPSHIRRSLTNLYALGYATGVGVDGKRRRPGTCTVVSLSNAGRRVAREALGLIHGQPVEAVAA